MKGDFSWFDYKAEENLTGVLEQVGRVRQDKDGLAAEEIGRNLRNLMGRDTFGPDRVAVPSEASDSLRITAAQTDGSSIQITYEPGRAWIDGVALFVTSVSTAEATYLPPPFQPETGPDSIADGVRDAVILEVWEDSVNAFQYPETLLESALGGVDTTARVKVCHRLRLRRLSDDEDCATIGPSLRDDPATIGRLTITPTPAIAIAGDCPVEAGGGYSGDGHHLFCIEIAPPGTNGPRFAWSRHGGGLVGRGRFDDVAGEIAITHNRPMIDAANVTGYYLQALAPDPATGCWNVQFQATVSLDSGVLLVSDAEGTWPAAAGEEAFFRLWDGIEDIADFTGAATELVDGIQLQFDPVINDGENYRPDDRWLFPVRAAGSGFDPSLWPQNALPQALLYHRAPLGILTWTSAAPDSILAPDDIEDCRDGFPPLSDPTSCCTIIVGDGTATHGDTDSIEAAIDRLPASGGKICLLPGLHATNAVITERSNIRITGCGKDTRIVPRPGARETPIFHVIDSECIILANMDMISLSGVAILGESSDDDALREFTVAGNRILACIRAIQIEGGTQTRIHENRIRMLDKADAGVAVYLSGADSRIEDNDIGVVPATSTPLPPDRPDDLDNPDDPIDPCADAELIYANFGFFVSFVEFIFGFTLTSILPPPYQALGGIQIGAGTERTALLDNRILGGAGNGVTLGGSHLIGADPGADPDEPVTQNIQLSRSVIAIRGTVIAPQEGPAANVALRLVAPSGTAQAFLSDANGQFEIRGSRETGTHLLEAVDPGLGVASAVVENSAGSLVSLRIELNRRREAPDPVLGFLYAIRIENNEISAMGLNGIGIAPALEVLSSSPGGSQPDSPDTSPIAPRFSIARAATANPLLALLGNPVIDLTILNNRITGNLQSPFTAAMREASRIHGFGGISLGLCETVSVAHNLIEANGLRHIDPVCGIFVLFGEQVEITGNLIRENGPFIAGNAEIERGQRGGIAGIFFSIGLDEFGENQAIVSSKPALRVHDNVVQQPLGRALTVVGAGPISIVANSLYAERTGSEILDRMAGTALVFSLSGIGTLPSGGCLINSNQITLGPDSTAFIALALAAGEDVGLEANQIDAMQTGFSIGNVNAMLNTLIWARTIRAVGNRFQERELSTNLALQMSLLSLTTQMNTATSNQGDHCIFAFDQSSPPRLVDSQNLVLDNTFCDELTNSAAGAAASPIQGTAGLQSLAFLAQNETPTGNGLIYATGLNRTLSDLNGYQRTQLASAVEIKTVSRALMTNEVARLETRANTRADLLAASIARRDAASLDTERLRAAIDVVSTRPEVETEESGLVIQGRVTDLRGRGLVQREVSLGNAEGEPITRVKPVRTDVKGSYVFRIDEAGATAVRKQTTKGATIVVSPGEKDQDAIISRRFIIKGTAIIAPELKITRTIATVPTRPRPIIPRQPIVRPVLLEPVRRRPVTERISPLVRRSRPARPGQED